MKDLRSYAEAFVAACEGVDAGAKTCASLTSPLACMYKDQPSAMRYEMECNKMANLGDVVRHFKDARRLYFDAEKGLNACGQGFLARENGLYLMALIDCVELCSEQLYEHYRAMIDIFRESMRGLLRWQDEVSGLFFKVTDQPAGEGNDIDVCGSAMAAYALYKAVRLCVLDGEKYLPIADCVFESVSECIPAGEAKVSELTGVCLKVCREYLLTGKE